MINMIRKNDVDKEEMERALMRSTRRNALARVDHMEEDDNPGFHMSFTDLMSLLLVFFVLFFSMTKSSATEQGTPTAPEAVNNVSVTIGNPGLTMPDMEDKKAGLLRRLVSASSAWAEGMVSNEQKSRQRALDMISHSLLHGETADLPSGQLNTDPKKDLLLNHLSGKSNGWGTGAAQNLIRPEKTESEPQDMESSKLLAGLKGLQKDLPEFEMELIQKDKSVVLTIGEKITFEEGRAEIKKEFREMLGHLASRIAAGPSLNRIRIKGHTDSKPINTAEFPSNWELSGARAARVARLLIDNGVEPKLIEAIGYSEFQPRAENSTDISRALNRRVEIELVTG